MGARCSVAHFPAGKLGCSASQSAGMTSRCSSSRGRLFLTNTPAKIYLLTGSCNRLSEEICHHSNASRADQVAVDDEPQINGEHALRWQKTDQIRIPIR